MHIVDHFLPAVSFRPAAHRPEIIKTPEVSSETSSISELARIAKCPTAPTLSPSAKTLAKQGKAVAEQVSLQSGGGAAAAPVARQLEQFRQGICPYLGQMIKNAPADQDWSALGLLQKELHSAQLDPVDFFHKAAQEYGNAFQVGDVRFEGRAEVAQQILAWTDNPKSANDHFAKSPFQTESLGAAYGHDNIFLAGEQAWQDRRALMAPFFTAEAVVNREVHSHLLTTVNRHLDRWAGSAQPVDLGARLPELTLDTSLHYMFGADLSPGELEKTAKLFKKVGHQVTDNLLGRGSAADAATEKELDTFAARILRGRERGQDRKDLLQALLDSPVGLNKQALRNEVVTMALLGHETTANLLGWSLAELADHPAEMARFRKEVDDLGPASFEQSRDLKWGREVLRETARLHPPNYLLMREAKHDVTLDSPEGPFKVAAGTQVLLPVSVINQQAAGADAPAEWDPERSGTKLLSFGGGHRVCLGQVFARLEAGVVLSEIVRRFELEPVIPGVPGPHTEFSSAPSQELYHLRPLSKG